MKKLISLVLSLALVLSVFCMSVGAANVVGTHKGEGLGNIDDGLSETAWDSESSLSDVITLNVSGQHHRYAVDITFNGTFTFGTGEWIWDVNNLEYYTETGSLQMSNSEYTFVVDNYSSKPVYAKCEIASRDEYLDEAEIEITLESTVSATETHTVGTLDFAITASDTDYIIGKLNEVKTEGVERGQRKPTQVTFTANMISNATGSTDEEKWNISVGKYLMHGNATSTPSFTLARFTVTVSKNEITPPTP